MNKWKRAEEEPWPLEVAVEKFCNGIVPCGPYYDHVMGYKKESLERPNKVFFITYEELMNDSKTHVKSWLNFRGVHFKVKTKKSKWRTLLRVCSIEVPSNHEVNKSEDFPSWFQVSHNSFFRRGVVGDNKNYLDNEILERIDALTREILFLWFHLRDLAAA
ncbi:Cytosolic sulfotransferase 3 [Abeliophyllum distichum]|uniref:Sulfotransferase n=1 Tax=Abeliophyllum distichum TaxID=126358 RepID=A0ABD1QL69_9LAMI